MAPPGAPSARAVLVGGLLLVLVNTIFGGYSVFTSAVLKGTTLNGIVFAFLRDTAASLLLMTAAWAHEARKPAPARRFWIAQEDTWLVLLGGLLMVWGAQGCSALALVNLSPVVFGMAQPLLPVVTVALSLALGFEHFAPTEWTSWGKLAGIGVTLAGAGGLVLASAGSTTAPSRNFGLGLFYTALQVVLGGAMHPVQKTLLNRGYDSVTVVAWSYLLGTGLLLLCVLTSAMDAADWAVSPLAGAAVAYAAVLSSAVAYSLMAYVNATVSPVMVAAFSPLQGVMTAVIAWAALGQSLGLAGYAGGGVVCAGLLLTVACRYVESLSRGGGGGGAGGQRGAPRGPAGGDGAGGRGGGDGGDEEDDADVDSDSANKRRLLLRGAHAA